MRKIKRALSFVLIIALLLSGFPNIGPVFAAEKEESNKIIKEEVKQDIKSPDIEAAKISKPIKYEDRADRELIVKYKDDSKKTEVKTKLKSAMKLSKLDTKKSFKKSKAELLEVEEGQNLDDIITELQSDPNVEYVQPNYKLTISTTPVDPRFSEQWALYNQGQEIEGMPGRTGVDINAINAWDKTKGSASVVIGVLDTGIDTNHNDLKSNIYTNPNEIPGNNKDDDNNGYIDDVNGWDFANADNTVYDSPDKDYHGTYVAGVIAAKADTTGITGVAPNVKVMPLKFINGQTGYTCDVIEAIEYAMKMNVKILNCSFGGTDNNLALKDAMQNSGILFVVAGGNRGGDIYSLPVYPAAFDLPNILAVAAIDNYGVLAPFSTYGNRIHVAAPGVNILSTTPENSYDYFSGTSVAAPFVTGIAALLKSQYPNSSITEISDRIKNNVVTSNSLMGKIATGGRVDARAAIDNIKPAADPYSGPGSEIITIPGGNQGGETDTWYTLDQYSKIKEKLHYGESGVSPASGNFSFTVTDMSIPAPGFEVNISRTYNSRDEKTKPMGKGWTFGFEGSAKGSDLVTVSLPNGSVQRFRKDGTAYKAEDSRSTFVKNGDGTFTLTTKDQYSYGFTKEGWLNWMKDRNGNTVSIIVDTQGKITAITDTVNRKYQIAYNAQGLIDNIKDEENRVIKYEYDARGYLLRVMDPTGAYMRYGYDSEGFINSIQDHDQKTVELLTYNHAVGVNQHKVVQATDANGNINNYAYDATNKKTTIKDQKGRTWTYWFDSEMYTIKVQDPEDKIAVTEYYMTGGKNIYGDIKAAYDRNGNKTEYDIDDRGNVTKITNPDQSSKSFGYDDKNNLVWEKDELGKYTFYIYDAGKINLIKKLQPLNGTDQYPQIADLSKYAVTGYEYFTKAEAQTQFNCNVAGLLKNVTDPGNNTIQYTYDQYGNTATVTDAESNLSTTTYNKIGWKLSTITPKGYVTQYEYDNNGQLERQIQDNGETARITYDKAGRKTKEVSPNQYNAALDNKAAHTYTGTHGYRYEYFDSGLLKSVTDPENNITQYTYDVYGNVLTETKPNSSIYRYEYDMLDRPTKTYFRDSAEAPEVLLEEYSYVILSDHRTQTTHKQYLNDTEAAENVSVYDYANRLVEQQNPDGSKQKFSYNPNGTLAASTAADGSVTVYKYDGLNRLTEQYTPFEVIDGSTKYSYQKLDYDKSGKKIKVSQSAELVELDSRPTTLIYTSYTYYKNGLLKSVIDSEGRRSDYAYDIDGNRSKEENYSDTVSKQVVEYVYNHLGKVETKTVHVNEGAIYGNAYESTADKTLVTSYTYDKNGNLKTVKTPDNVVTTTTYDNLDRLKSTSQPGQNELGEAVTITGSTTYNWQGQPLTQTDARGNVTTYEYNKRGLLTKTTNPEQGVTAYDYDRAGRRTIEVSPKNYEAGKALSQLSRIEYVYDTMGRVKAKKDIYYDDRLAQWKTLYTASYKYDVNGNVIKELSALGYEAGTGSTLEERINTGYGTKYTYNLANKLVTMLDPVSQDRQLSHTLSYDYDGLGRRISETNAKGVITLYQYDGAGNILSVRLKANADAEPQTIKTATYDLLGRQTTQTDGNGNITTFVYNKLGKISKTVYSGDTTIAANTITYQYDVMGNLAKQQDSLGKVNLYTYDNQNRMLTQTEQKSDGTDKITLTLKYDVNGNKRLTTDGNGTPTEYTYDKINRLKTAKITVNDIEQTTTYGYDANGNQTTLTDWRGNTSTNVYDRLNRLIEQKDAKGITAQRLEYNSNSLQSKAYDALGYATTYQYDKNNRLLSTIDPEGHTTGQAYDDAGNIITKTDGRNITITYQYDKRNRLKSVTNAKLEVTSYTYDNNGNLLTQTDGNGHITTFEYNARNLMIKKIDHEGRLGLPGHFNYLSDKLESYTYNPDGSLKTTRDRKVQTTDYTYDIHGRLKNKKIGNNEISYTYDGSGNQLTMTDSTGTTTRTYDELNRTLTKEVPDIGTSTYLYDLTEGIPAGYTKETTKDPKGNTVAKTYDKTGRLYQVITAEGPTTYTYYDNGNRKSIIYPNGIKEEYTYYKDNLLKTLTNKKADGSVIDTYSYGYDAAHNQTVKQDAKGTTEYTYDSLNRLATVQEPGGKKTSYTYDKAGNRLTETIGTQEAATAVTTYTYNEQNRLQSTVTVQGNGLSEKLTYNYDDNGNMVSKFRVKLSLEDPNLQGSFELFKAGEKENSDISFYEYDVWNQLVKTTEGTNKISYGYNGEGYRVEKTINGETARYLYEYDKVILEVDGAGNETASNVYGLNLVSKTAEGETAYYLYNGHADVTSLIDETGNIVGTYYYDAFGNITEKTGDVKNNITYAGYQYDEETELYYLNARYYDSKIARFMTEDTYRGSVNDPLSLNLYSYVSNNPIRYKDPTGHWQQGDEDYDKTVRVELSRLTDAYFAAKTQTEKDAIHKAANDLRENSTKYGNQDGSTGSNYNNIVADKADGYKYVTASEWSSISTTKNDKEVKDAIRDGKISQNEINMIASSKPTNTVVNKTPSVESIVRKNTGVGQPILPFTKDLPVILVYNTDDGVLRPMTPAEIAKWKSSETIPYIPVLSTVNNIYIAITGQDINGYLHDGGQIKAAKEGLVIDSALALAGLGLKLADDAVKYMDELIEGAWKGQIDLQLFADKGMNNFRALQNTKIKGKIVSLDLERGGSGLVNIHVKVDKTKYFYDFENGKFLDKAGNELSKSISQSKDVQNALQKALEKLNSGW